MEQRPSKASVSGEFKQTTLVTSLVSQSLAKLRCQLTEEDHVMLYLDYTPVCQMWLVFDMLFYQRQS
jgi:hypothetical protein